MEPQVFRLPEYLDLTAAAPLRAHLSALSEGPLDLDASGVQRVGGLSLQVLLAADIAWNANDQELRVVNPSESFVEGMRLMGVPDLKAWVEEQKAS